MKKIFFSIIFLCVLATKFLAALDSRIGHVMSQLQFLPPWCSPALFFMNDCGSTCEGYRIEKETDGSGHVVNVTLVQLCDGSVAGKVAAVWEKGRVLDRLIRVEGEKIVHLFEYDENDCAVKHVLQGDLRGKGEHQERYETIFRFDEEHRPVEIHEANGRVRILKYPSSSDEFFVIVDKGVGNAFRHAARGDGNTFEVIEDNGWNTDINDLSTVTWRQWKKAAAEEDLEGLCQTTIVGAYNPHINANVVLRKEKVLLTPSGEVRGTEVYDSNDLLVSKTLGLCDHSIALPMSLEEVQELIRRIQNPFPSLEETSAKAFGGSDQPVEVLYTSRGQVYEVTYKDGARDDNEYSLDGVLRQKLFRDGHRIVTESDCQGRLLSSSRWEVGACVPSVIWYTYEGPFLSGWKTDEGTECQLKRDCFGRVISIELTTESGCERYDLTVDPLDRVTRVSMQGNTSWQCQRWFSVDGDSITTEFSRSATTSIVRETRRADGTVQMREEEIAPGVSVVYIYDDKERVTRIEHAVNGVRHLAVQKQYEMAEDGSIFQVTSCFPDLTKQIEERDLCGNLIGRKWLSSEGKIALEEKVSPLDENGSMRLTRSAGGEERSIEWIVGESGHLEKVGSALFEYDEVGHCIGKRSPLGREIRYEWNSKSQMTRQYSADGTVNYQFTYDDSGRIIQVDDVTTGHCVSRSFDAQGRLVSDGEKESHVLSTYDDSGALINITLPGGSSLRYENGRVYKEGADGSWCECIEEKPHTQDSMYDSMPNEKAFRDELGSWIENFSYDDVGQLQHEAGEFQLSFDFDAFGMSKAALESISDEDGYVIEYGTGENRVSFSYDALGRVVRFQYGTCQEQYRYDGFGRVQEIILNNGVHKHLCWLGENELGAIEKGKLIELKVLHPVFLHPIVIEVKGKPYRVSLDARGSITALYSLSSGALCEVYRYSAFGDLHVYGASISDTKPNAISPWLYCGKRLLNAVYDFGARRYSVPLKRWLEKDPLGFVDTPDDRMYVRNNPVAFTDPTGLFPLFVNWADIKNSFLQAVQCIATRTYKSLTFAKQRLDWLLEFRSTYEDLFFKLFGMPWLRCSGYNLDSTSQYVYGEGEKSSKVRITLINGILNGIPEARRSAALLSSTHGNMPVHFVYAATEGFSGDMLRGAFAKAGIPSRQAKLLVDLWRELIHEMGGVEGGGTIFHYAHSLGATDTLNALQLLDPEERKLIRVATFGAPTLLDDGICSKVDNYVSVKDGVPIIDIRRYMDGAKGNRSNVHFIPSNVSLPLVDHFFNGKTYKGVLELLGQKFQEEFLLATK